MTVIETQGAAQKGDEQSIRTTITAINIVALITHLQRQSIRILMLPLLEATAGMREARGASLEMKGEHMVKLKGLMSST